MFWIFAIFLEKSKLKTALRFHELLCRVLDFCKMSKISTWSLVNFGLLLFVEGTSFNATPHFEEWQCFGKINFEEPNCHRLVALPQVSIVVQAVEVLLYLPWTAVYASTYCEFGKDFPGQSLLFLDYWVLLLLPRILRVVVVRKPREWAPKRERSMI